MINKGHISDKTPAKRLANVPIDEQIVLEKSVFSKVFDKDIKRVYLYKKTERIAKAIHMICPAFKDCRPLRERMERISVELVDASILPGGEARERLPRHLLALSSSLEMGKSGGFLSPMNADIILREAHQLLQEVASYEEPRISLPEAPTVHKIVRESVNKDMEQKHIKDKPILPSDRKSDGISIPGTGISDRRQAILDILASLQTAYIKDISTKVRDVSEKTIQRELQQLISEGVVGKRGDRRWTTYFLVRDGSSPRDTVTTVD